MENGDSSGNRPWIAHGLPWLAVPVILCFIVGVWAADLDHLHVSPSVLVVVEFLFSTTVLFIVAYVAGRSFLSRGEPGLLLFGCGALVWGAASFVSSGNTYFDVNLTPTITGCSAWICALCHLLGAVVSLREPRVLRPTGMWLAVFYGLAIACVALIASAAWAGSLPTFFVQGRGGTPIRYAVLGSAVTMFGLTALTLTSARRTPLSSFAYYYALGLSLLATGFFGVMLQASVFSTLFWLSIVTQALGGVSMLAAAVSVVREHSPDELSLASLRSDWREGEWIAKLRRHAWSRIATRYGAAVLGVWLAAAGQMFLASEVGPGLGPFVTFYPALIATALLGGLGPGLLVTGLSMVVIDVWLLPTADGHFDMGHLGPAARVSFVMFAATGLFASGVAGLYRRNREKAAAYDREAAVRETRQRLAAFADAAFEGIVETERGRMVDCNPQFAAIVGYSESELKGMEVSDLVAPEDRARVMENITQQYISCIEHGVIRKDGSRILVEARGRQVGTGGIRRHTAVRDITQRKLMEQELRLAKERLETSIARSPLAIVEFDPDYRVIRWSGTAMQVFGWKAEEVIGRKICELRWVHEEDVPLVSKNSEDMLLGRRSSIVNVNRNYRKDGTVILCEWYSAAIYDQQGRLMSVFSQVLDVTERRKAEAALRASEERFHTLFATINEAFVLKEAVRGADGRIHDFRFLEANPAFKEQTGLRDVVGKTMREAVPGIESRWIERFAEVIETGKSIRFQDTVGSMERWYDVVAYRVGGPGTSQVAMLFSDITERRRSEVALRKAEEQLREHAKELEETVRRRTAKLQETVEQLEQYSYSISHDLRAPLRAMNQYSEFLLEECASVLPEQGRSYLKGISAAAIRMDRLISEVLTYHRLVRAEMALDPVDLEPLVWDIVTQYPVVQQSKARIEIRSPIGSVQANVAAVTQCLSNLLCNAVKFVAPGCEPVVTVWSEPRGDFIRVCVEDNGIGIGADRLERVWGMFQQVHDEKEYDGTGIGLAIVKKAVERMGGRVGVESTPGKGSVFCFELRKVEARPLPGKRRAYGGITATSAGPAKTDDQKVSSVVCRILGIDDSEDDLFFLCRAIEKDSQLRCVGTLSSGEDAVKYFRREGPYADVNKYPSPDLVFLDLKMPGMDGFGVLGYLQLNVPKRSFRVVVLTSSQAPADEQRCKALGADGYEIKPGAFQGYTELLQRTKVMGEKAH